MVKNKIVIKNLIKNFDTKEVLKGIDLEIKEGESIVLLGASGCGKTVFIKILACLMQASSGSIKIDDHEITTMNEFEKEKVISKISFLFQLNALFDSMPIWKNICLAKIENENLSKQQAMEIAKKRLEEVGLGEEVTMLLPSSVSGGMQKRVALARCLSANPEIIFFDEPTTGLDPQTSIKISHLIRSVTGEQGKKITKISIMHDINCAKIVADKFVFFHQGKVEWCGTVQEMETSENEILKAFIKSH